MKNKALWSLRAKVAELENIFADDRTAMRADRFYKTQAEALAMVDDLISKAERNKR